MWALAERWCDLSGATRLGCGLAMLCLACALCGFYYPQDWEQEKSDEITLQWRRTLALRSSQAPMVTDLQPFSVMDFQSPQCRLVSWQPLPTGGELVLETQWDALLNTFELLAQRGMRVSGFSMTPARPRLRTTLQLEVASHE